MRDLCLKILLLGYIRVFLFVCAAQGLSKLRPRRAQRVSIHIPLEGVNNHRRDPRVKGGPGFSF